jgi:hypothetical protein
VCVSLEEWGARIFRPHNKTVLRDAKSGCEKNKQRFDRATTVIDEIRFTTTDLTSSKVSSNNNDEGQEHEDAAMAYKFSPDCHKDQTKEMLLYNLGRGIQLLLDQSGKKIIKKRKLKKGKRMITESLL